MGRLFSLILSPPLFKMVLWQASSELSLWQFHYTASTTSLSLENLDKILGKIETGQWFVRNHLWRNICSTLKSIFAEFTSTSKSRRFVGWRCNSITECYSGRNQVLVLLQNPTSQHHLQSVKLQTANIIVSLNVSAFFASRSLNQTDVIIKSKLRVLSPLLFTRNNSACLNDVTACTQLKIFSLAFYVNPPNLTDGRLKINILPFRFRFRSRSVH